MNPKIVPRKHRKHIYNLIATYKKNIGQIDYGFTNWEEFLMLNLSATEDGWLETNNKEYQALLWIIEITNSINHLQKYE